MAAHYKSGVPDVELGRRDRRREDEAEGSHRCARPDARSRHLHKGAHCSVLCYYRGDSSPWTIGLASVDIRAHTALRKRTGSPAG
jgi:hypothetical protein